MRPRIRAVVARLSEQARGRREALELLLRQGEAFGLSRDDIGLSGALDPQVDFLPGAPTGRYAG